MLTRANKPVPSRPKYPTEKEALATHTVPFTDFIKEMLVNAQLIDEIHPLTPLKVVECLPCSIAEALTSTYPDMILDAVVGFRLMVVAKMLSTPELTKEMFRDDLLQKLAKVNGCWPALLDITKGSRDIGDHLIRLALWNSFYNYDFEITGDHLAAYKFAALYKDDINYFFHYDLKRCVLSYGPNDKVSITKETLEHITTEIMLRGRCETFPVNVEKGPAVVFS
jgi:hypothetical protein